uniref:NADH-ubiquinone oxidoreductase chain 6 n=2 Tax=Nemaliophycidae TaxID=2045258 RepID=A0A8T9EJX4_9FLOR|nr:NADH dehydrogenase subunit 6 [Thorea hispida]ARX95968.1 NADH dehydrogenase subunit 6 [Thorea hispida]UNJ79228.1 NADH dehydrogenase subunit 6 [Audouinella sp.]
MNVEFYLFYLFSIFIIFSSIMVISLRNAVYSILFLILTFFNTIILFLLIGAEFLSFLFLIVYVGAVAILFLFVLMMLNIKLIRYKINSWSVIAIGFILLFYFIIQIILIYNHLFEFLRINYTPSWNNWLVLYHTFNNVQVIGKVLYTKYNFLFITSSLILLVAMVGTILLTMHQRSNLRTQNVATQVQQPILCSIKLSNLKN